MNYLIFKENFLYLWKDQVCNIIFHRNPLPNTHTNHAPNYFFIIKQS